MSPRLRVLHVPDSVGGNPQGLARAERELGLQSVSVVSAPSPFGYEADETLRGPGVGRLRYEFRRAKLLGRALRDFDVIHFNFGRTILPQALRMADLRILRRAGKVIAVTFQGDDIRQGSVSRLRGGLSLPVAVPEAYPPELDTERRRRVTQFERFAHIIGYLNPDLAHVLPRRAVFLPYAHVDPRAWSPIYPSVEASVPVIVHAPSSRDLKGTKHVLEAVRRLSTEGLDLELALVENLPQAQARRVYERATLAIDQLYAGWYGGFAVEAMALGVPVLAYIRDDDLDVVPRAMRDDLPILQARPESLVNVLRHYLTDGRADLAKFREQARRYVERWHDPLRIAAQLEQRYDEALRSIRR